MAARLYQASLFGEDDATSELKRDTSSTFADNLSLPVHRWFRYSAGFSAQWVGGVIAEANRRGAVRVLDPFAGSGTVLVEAQDRGVAAVGLESHPFVARIAKAKLTNIVDSEAFREYGSGLLNRADRISPDMGGYAPLIRKCYPDDVLAQLDQLRQAWSEESGVGEDVRDLGWLALASILRECSPVGTANWQYVLPNKSKSRSSFPFVAFKAKVGQIAADLDSRSGRPVEGGVSLINGDARELGAVQDQWATLVITSPPYPNNFDYADATRLEMTFFGEISGWGDLQHAVRRHLIRSCTQHVSSIARETDQILAAEELAPISSEIRDVCERLKTERETRAGKKPYHTMIAAYFLDMARVWTQLRRVMSDGRVCFVVGDSAPYGVYVPVDRWMGELALASGFHSFAFEKTRDRNVKWKNRKHRVPLHEGRLWVEA